MECRRHRTGPGSDEIPRRRRTGLVRGHQADLGCGTGRPGERSRAVTRDHGTGRLITHPTRTIIAVLGTQELPSDLAGRHYIRLSHTAVEPLHDLDRKSTRLNSSHLGISYAV